jgi:putative ABC transport system permease protein
VNLLAWCYARLLVLYPREFRDRYRTAMCQLFRDRCRDARRRHGALGAIGVSAVAFVDLVTNAFLERVLSNRADLVSSSLPTPPRPASARPWPGETLMLDLRLAIRRLVHEPGFTAIVVITLALGIGATTTIFSVIDGVLLRPLPYRDADRLLTVWQWSKSKGIEEAPSPGNFLDWRDASGLVDLAAAVPDGVDLTNSGDPIGLDTWRVSERFFETLGVQPALGRTFHADEHVAGRDRVVILSHAFWRTRFGGDPSVVGRTITLDNESCVVVGVMPPHVDYPSRKQIWIPKVFGESERRARMQTYYQVIARLKPGATIEQARAELSDIADRLATALPRTNKDVGIVLDPVFTRVTGSVRPILLLILGAVGCVLVIACANAANLLLARAAARQPEMAVRTALGAGRVDLLRLTLTESAVLTVCAATVGVVVSYWAVAALVRLAPADIPRLDEIGLNAQVLAFAVAIASATALLCGVAPAVQFWTRSIDARLRAGGRSSTAAGGRFRSALVVGQTALAVLLLVGNGLLIRSFTALLRVDLGYRVDRRVALTMHVWTDYPQPDRRALFFAEAEQRIARQPGVLSVGAASALPLSHEGSEMDPPFTVAGRPTPAPGDEPTALVTFVTPGYFQTIGMRLVAGRLLTDRDSASSPPVVVVNEAMAQRIWPGESAIGKRITSRLSFSATATREVVGVVGDVRQGGLHDRTQPAYYVPHRQVPFGSMTIVVRTTADAASAAPSVQRTIWSVNPRVSFAGIETLDGLLRDTLAPRRFTLTLLSGFAFVAIALASVGLYGLVSFSVTQRTTEIGIRMALGAGVPSVLALVMKEGLTIAWLGLAGGVAAAFVMTRYLSAMLFGVQPTDPMTFTTLSLAVVAVSAVACYVPARRAARVDPIAAIRED